MTIPSDETSILLLSVRNGSHPIHKRKGVTRNLKPHDTTGTYIVLCAADGVDLQRAAGPDGGGIRWPPGRAEQSVAVAV